MIIPWLLAVATAIWFGLTARRAERDATLWSLGGGFFALVVSTIVFGLGHAAAMPFSAHERARLHVQWTGEAVVLIGILGWLFTLGLYRRGQKFLNQEKPAGAAAPQPANRAGATDLPKAPPSPPKQS
jgi:hypothetical protein